MKTQHLTLVSKLVMKNEPTPLWIITKICSFFCGGGGGSRLQRRSRDTYLLEINTDSLVHDSSVRVENAWTQSESNLSSFEIRIMHHRILSIWRATPTKVAHCPWILTDTSVPCSDLVSWHSSTRAAFPVRLSASSRRTQRTSAVTPESIVGRDPSRWPPGGAGRRPAAQGRHTTARRPPPGWAGRAGRRRRPTRARRPTATSPAPWRTR